MTRITFLIGNGFDLNVGLNTKYKEFYDYYITNHPDDLLAMAIEGKEDVYWSDLELGLGRYTAYVKAEDEDDFWDSEQLLEQELVNYLEAQMARVNLKDEERKLETAVEMQRSLTEFYQELPGNLQQHINNVFDGIRESIVYSFITFNYTNVLDQCLNVTKKAISKDFGKHNCNGGLIYSHFIGEVLHVHGTTKAEMILGVNDENQIANEEFKKNSLYRQYLIKEETSRRYNRERIDEAYRTIDESIVVCIFGMSIGSTDKMWWHHICDWLLEAKERLLIIYTIVKGNWIGKRALFAQQDEMLNRLKNNADISNEVWNDIKDQVYVKCNTGIFNFNIIDRNKS